MEKQDDSQREYTGLSFKYKDNLFGQRNSVFGGHWIASRYMQHF